MGLFETLGEALKPNPDNVKTLDQAIIDAGRIIARELYEDTPGKHVGGQVTTKFTHEEKEYSITVDAFWEKSRHFDYRVVGVGHDFLKHKNCNEF